MSVLLVGQIGDGGVVGQPSAMLTATPDAGAAESAVLASIGLLVHLLRTASV